MWAPILPSKCVAPLKIFFVCASKKVRGRHSVPSTAALTSFWQSCKQPLVCWIQIKVGLITTHNKARLDAQWGDAAKVFTNQHSGSHWVLKKQVHTLQAALRGVILKPPGPHHRKLYKKKKTPTTITRHLVSQSSGNCLWAINVKKGGQGKLKVCHIFLLYGEQKIAETQVLLSKIPAPACSLQADPPIEGQRTDDSVCRFSPEWEARKKKTGVLAMDEASCDQDNCQILSNDKADKEDTTARVMVFITVKMYISACLIYILLDFFL